MSTQAGWDGFVLELMGAGMDLYWSLVELGAQHRLHSKLCVSFATPCMNHWLQAALSSPLRLCREGENRVRCLSWGSLGPLVLLGMGCPSPVR